MLWKRPANQVVGHLRDHHCTCDMLLEGYKDFLMNDDPPDSMRIL
jgi:hypothetical protein